LVESVLMTVAFFGLNTGTFPATSSTFPIMVWIARGAAALLVFYAVIAGLWILFASHWRPIELTARYHFKRLFSDREHPGHIVICGLGDTGIELALALANRGERVVAVEHSFSAPVVARARSAGVIVFEDDATKRSSLRKRAKIELASDVYITCGSDETNAEVVQSIADCISMDERDRSLETPIRCFVDLTGREYRHHLHNQIDAIDGFRLYSYDVATATARELLQSVPVDRLDRNPEAQRVSVVLVGWTEYIQAVLSELCHTMHYGPRLDRSITVICESPAQAEAEFLNQYPGINPTEWTDEQIQEFVADLFPPISFQELAASDERVVTGSTGIADEFKQNDVLTVVVDAAEEQHSSSAVSLMKSHLEQYEREFGMDTHVLYYNKADYRASQTSVGVNPVDSESVCIKPFTDFWDGIDPESIQGEPRDTDARQIALFYHLLYSYDRQTPTTAVDTILLQLGVDSIQTIDEALATWDELSDENRRRLETVCWGELSEEYRDSNRHAADHARIKRRLVAHVSESNTDAEVHNRLARLEHRRWCAEKFLRRWTPLPFGQWSRWDDDATQTRFRDRRIHRDVWPLEVLNKQAPDAFEKDVAQVRFVLEQLETDQE